MAGEAFISRSRLLKRIGVISRNQKWSSAQFLDSIEVFPWGVPTMGNLAKAS